MSRAFATIVAVTVFAGLTAISTATHAQPALSPRGSGSALVAPSPGESSLGSAPGTNLGTVLPGSLGAAPGTSLGGNAPSSQSLGAAPGTSIGTGRP